MTRLAVIVATAGGAGYAPVAPGTAGAVVGVVLFLAIGTWPLLAAVFFVAAVTVLGTWASGRAARHFGRKDPQVVVVDEVAGQLVSLLGTGAGAWGTVAGFVLFRLFDIVKPWPVGRLEALPGGIGIMADDLMAGLYANLVLQAVIRLAPELGL